MFLIIITLCFWVVLLQIQVHHLKQTDRHLHEMFSGLVTRMAKLFDEHITLTGHKFDGDKLVKNTEPPTTK